MKFGPDDTDDFDLATIPSSDLRVITMNMLHAAVVFNRLAVCHSLRLEPLTRKSCLCHSSHVPRIGTDRALLVTLLATGADAGDYWRGQTPLFTAASTGRIWLVRMLHEHNDSLVHHFEQMEGGGCGGGAPDLPVVILIY